MDIDLIWRKYLQSKGLDPSGDAPLPPGTDTRAFYREWERFLLNSRIMTPGEQQQQWVYPSGLHGRPAAETIAANPERYVGGPNGPDGSYETASMMSDEDFQFLSSALARQGYAPVPFPGGFRGTDGYYRVKGVRKTGAVPPPAPVRGQGQRW